jgi:hypothetical protein
MIRAVWSAPPVVFGVKGFCGGVVNAGVVVVVDGTL